MLGVAGATGARIALGAGGTAGAAELVDAVATAGAAELVDGGGPSGGLLGASGVLGAAVKGGTAVAGIGRGRTSAATDAAITIPMNTPATPKNATRWRGLFGRSVDRALTMGIVCVLGVLRMPSLVNCGTGGVLGTALRDGSAGGAARDKGSIAGSGPRIACDVRDGTGMISVPLAVRGIGVTADKSDGTGMISVPRAVHGGADTASESRAPGALWCSGISRREGRSCLVFSVVANAAVLWRSFAGRVRVCGWVVASAVGRLCRPISSVKRSISRAVASMSRSSIASSAAFEKRRSRSFSMAFEMTVHTLAGSPGTIKRRDLGWLLRCHPLQAR